VTPTYKRVLLKLTGEEIGGGKLGVDPDVVSRIAGEIAAVAATGVEIAVVIGGGNFFRGSELRQRGMNGVRADYMGMLGIVMNCLALQEFLEQRHVVTRVQTAIAMGQIAEPYVPLRAIRHLEKGRVVIFGAGMGLPFFTTDTVAVQRALETHCDAVLFTKNGVDGVYSADPKLDPAATRYDQLTYEEAISRNLRVIDQTAFTMAQENKIDLIVFGLQPEGNVLRVVQGERIGTLVTAD
jgi:uridylate kinase